MNDRCGAFPDPLIVPVHLAGPWLPSCCRDPGHEPPHRAQFGPYVTDEGELSNVLEWKDPPVFEQLMRDLEAAHGREAIRMWVERAPGPPLWGPAPKPVVISSLDEFRRAYGPAPDESPYDRMAALFSEGGDGDDGGSSYTVGQYGGIHELTMVPIPPGWRGWWVRLQCTRAYHAGQALIRAVPSDRDLYEGLRDVGGWLRARRRAKG